jgi:hypothetical protein
VILGSLGGSLKGLESLEGVFGLNVAKISVKFPWGGIRPLGPKAVRRGFGRAQGKGWDKSLVILSSYMTSILTGQIAPHRRSQAKSRYLPVQGFSGALRPQNAALKGKSIGGPTPPTSGTNPKPKPEAENFPGKTLKGYKRLIVPCKVHKRVK